VIHIGGIQRPERLIMTQRPGHPSPRALFVVVLAAATLVVTACSSSTAGPSSTSAAGSSVPASAAAVSSTAASSAGPSSAGTGSVAPASGEPAYVAALQPQLDQLMKDLSITGAGVLIRSPEGDWSTTMGTRTWHGTDPVTIADHIRIGSNTKPMTGTVILQLVDEGKISLDDPVSKYRPDVPNGDNITITQLLNMSSGLGNYTLDPYLNEQMDNNPGRAWTPDELLAMGYAQPVQFAPGQGYYYSNTNTVLLGVIIEQLTGMPVAEAFQQRIFDPLGLTETSFPAITDATVPDPHPTFYTWGTNVGTIDTTAMSPEVQAAALDGSREPIDTTDLNPSWGWTAGAAISTAEDLADFVEALAGGGLLSPELQAKRMTDFNPTKPDDPTNDTSYGLGIGRIGSKYGHIGEVPGTNSYMFYEPDQKITVITWTSTAPAPNGTPPAVALGDAAYAAVTGSG
jgi:D-alanyl-D-alanine carboxypeptidase